VGAGTESFDPFGIGRKSADAAVPLIDELPALANWFDKMKRTVDALGKAGR
jgi:hypothetical protein